MQGRHEFGYCGRLDHTWVSDLFGLALVDHPVDHRAPDPLALPCRNSLALAPGLGLRAWALVPGCAA